LSKMGVSMSSHRDDQPPDHRQEVDTTSSELEEQPTLPSQPRNLHAHSSERAHEPVANHLLAEHPTVETPIKSSQEATDEVPTQKQHRHAITQKEAQVSTDPDYPAYDYGDTDETDEVSVSNETKQSISTGSTGEIPLDSGQFPSAKAPSKKRTIPYGLAHPAPMAESGRVRKRRHFNAHRHLLPLLILVLVITIGVLVWLLVRDHQRSQEATNISGQQETKEKAPAPIDPN